MVTLHLMWKSVRRNWKYQHRGGIMMVKWQDINFNGDILSIRRYRRLLSIKYAIGSSGTHVSLQDIKANCVRQDFYVIKKKAAMHLFCMIETVIPSCIKIKGKYYVFKYHFSFTCKLRFILDVKYREYSAAFIKNYFYTKWFHGYYSTFL